MHNCAYLIYAVDPPEKLYDDNIKKWREYIEKMFSTILSVTQQLGLESIAIPIMDLSIFFFFTMKTRYFITFVHLISRYINS